MKNYKILAVVARARRSALAFSPQSRSRASGGGSRAIAAPVIVKVIDVVSDTAQRNRKAASWLKAEVIHADSRYRSSCASRDNGMAIHTFNFSPELQDKMQAMLDKADSSTATK